MMNMNMKKKAGFRLNIVFMMVVAVGFFAGLFYGTVEGNCANVRIMSAVKNESALISQYRKDLLDAMAAKAVSLGKISRDDIIEVVQAQLDEFVKTRPQDQNYWTQDDWDVYYYAKKDLIDLVASADNAQMSTI